MGWLRFVEDRLANLELFRRIAAESRKRGFTDMLPLGMGGSSACLGEPGAGHKRWDAQKTNWPPMDTDARG